MPLAHLFDAELQYQQDIEPVVTSEGREGELIGNGDGSVNGARLDLQDGSARTFVLPCRKPMRAALVSPRSG